MHRLTLDPEEIQRSHDIDIQCNLSDELRSSNTEESSWHNDWDEDNTPRHLSNEEEINRLKAIISEIELENDNLKDLNSQFYQASLQHPTTGIFTFFKQIIFIEKTFFQIQLHIN
jgi:hypothetical protein